MYTCVLHSSVRNFTLQLDHFEPFRQIAAEDDRPGTIRDALHDLVSKSILAKRPTHLQAYSKRRRQRKQAAICSKLQVIEPGPNIRQEQILQGFKNLSSNCSSYKRCYGTCGFPTSALKLLLGIERHHFHSQARGFCFHRCDGGKLKQLHGKSNCCTSQMLAPIAQHQSESCKRSKLDAALPPQLQITKNCAVTASSSMQCVASHHTCMCVCVCMHECVCICIYFYIYIYIYM